MKSVRLTLGHSAQNVHPMHRFAAERDDFERYHLIHWNYAHDGYNVFVFHVVGDRAAYRDALEDVDEVVTSDITPAGDSSFYVYIRERPDEIGERLIDAFSRGSLVPIPPLEYRDDWTVRFTLVGDPDDVRDALAAVPEEMTTTVESVGEYEGADAATADLTSRQREAVRVARDLGYFAVPRAASVDDVADVMGCAPGTAAEHLRKAEATVMGALEV